MKEYETKLLNILAKSMNAEIVEVSNMTLEEQLKQGVFLDRLVDIDYLTEDEIKKIRQKSYF